MRNTTIKTKVRLRKK